MDLYTAIVEELAKLRIDVQQDNTMDGCFMPMFIGTGWTGSINVYEDLEGGTTKLTVLAHEAVHAMQHILSKDYIPGIVIGYKNTKGLLTYVSNLKISPPYVKDMYRRDRDLEIEAYSLEGNPELVLSMLKVLTS